MEPVDDAEGSPSDSGGTQPTRRPRRFWIRLAAIGAVAAVLIAAFAVVSRPPNRAPTLTQAIANSESTTVGALVTFGARATDPDGDPLTYTWNFGDNSTATGANTTHAYSLPGRFVVLLTVTDGRGGEVTNDASLFFVHVRLRASDLAAPGPPPSTSCPLRCTPGPAAAILSADQTTVTKGTLVRFAANASWAYSWTWSNASNHSEGGASSALSAADDPTLFTTFTYGWGDGSPNTGGNSESAGVTSHRFAATGNFLVRLTLTLPTTAGVQSVVAGYTIRVSDAAPVTATRHPTVLTKVTFGEPDSLDPAVDAETSGGEILQNVYEPLVWYQPGTENVTVLVPRLAIGLPTAANGGISADGKNYTFTTRTDVKFHSGATMTPDDVVYSVQRVLAIHDPNGPSWILEQVLTNFVARYVDGCGPAANETCSLADYADRAFASRSEIPPNIRASLEAYAPETDWALHPLNRTVAWAISNSTIERGGTDQVVIHLTRPYPAFLQAMAFTVGSVVEKGCAKPDDGWGTRNRFLDRSGDCGTGPFRVAAWVPNQIVILSRFAGYWRGAAPIAEVRIEKASDVSTREYMLLAGDADVATISRDRQLDLATEDGTPRYTTLRIAKGSTTFDVTVFGYNQLINVSGAPDPVSVPATFFSDISVRRAFSYAFDYNAFLQNVTHDTGVQLRGPIAQGIPGYNMSTPVFTYNLTRAAEELQRTAYWTSGFNMTLYYNAGNTERKEGCWVLKRGLEALHTQAGAGPIAVTVQALDWPGYLRAFRSNSLPVFFLGWRPDYADPDDYVMPFLRTGGVFAARVGYSNATLDALIDAAAAELNQTKRVKMYQDLSSRAVIDDVPYLWVYQSKSFHVERTWVRNYYFHPMLSGLDYHRLSKWTP